jgi:hypothetical protein
MPPTGRVKPSASAPRLIAAPGSGADLTRVDAQARFQTPPVHIYAMGLDGPRAATSKRLEGNEHYLLPRQIPPNPRQVVMQRELSVGGGRSSRATWAEAKPSTAAAAATAMVAPLRTHIALPPEHRLPNSYLDADRRASAEPQTRGSTAVSRKLSTQDVSYLADRPGHGSATLPLRHGSPRHFVDYQIPPTQIPEADHVRVAAPQHGYTRPPGSGRSRPATYSSRRPRALHPYTAALWAPEQSNGLGQRSAALKRL